MIIGWDYMEQKTKEGKFAGEDTKPTTLVRFDRRNKWMIAEVVPNKGLNAYAVKVVSEEIEKSGYSRIIMKSDQEQSILALLRTARAERSESIETASEWSRAGESKSNRGVERAIRTRQGQARTMKLALETWCKRKTEVHHNVLPWLVGYAAMVMWEMMAEQPMKGGKQGNLRRQSQSSENVCGS